MLKKKLEGADQNLQVAFNDLNSLMEKAKEMVQLAERLSQQQEKEKKSQGETDELRTMLLNIGIASPVTKESAGSLYHQQLSRQLADWVQKPLAHSGGVIALTDLYCLFNRARGTALISPEDLHRACVLFEQLNLPVRLRKFESGVLVVQSASFNDEEIAKSITNLVRVNGPTSAFEVAKNKNISLQLATEQLLTAEKLGVVCRDDTFEGIVFYLNFFNDLSLVKIYIKK